jgi:VWFA-related protein
MLRALLALSTAITFAIPAVPQDPQEQGPALKRTVNLVNLFATVREKNKKIVGDLKQDDFKVFEDNEEQKLAFFSKEVTLPITLGLLIDTSPSEAGRLGAEQAAASQFIERVMRKGDEAMVISFDIDVDLLADFTDDRAQIERAVDKARIGGATSGGVVTPGTIPTGANSGGTHFYDAVYLACHDQLVSEAGRKALVIITDAEDQGSRLRVEEAIEAAQRTDTVVHILYVHDFGYGRPDVARKMSDETGGRMIDVGSAKKLNEAFDQISEELRSQYTLGYYPKNAAKDGRFRRVRVETANKDYKILTRKGYYAPRN